MLPKAPRLLLALLAAGLLAACTEDARPGGERPVTATPAVPQKSAADFLAEGDRAAASGDLYAAVDAFAQALRRDPASATAAGRLGLMLSAQGRQAEAVDPLSRALAADPGDLTLARALANAHLGLERPEPAAALLERAVRQSPADARLWNALGIARDMLGDPDAALLAYRAGLGIDPQSRALNTNLALSRQAAGDPAGAERAAAVAGLTVADLEARAAALTAYRDRVRARAQAAAPAGPSAAPTMPAMALAPVQVQEMRPAAQPAAADPAALQTVPPPAVQAAAAPPAPAAPPPVQPVAAASPPAAEPAPAPAMQAAPPAEAPALPPPVPAAPAAAPPPPAAPEPAPARVTWTDRASAFVQIASYNREGLAEPAWTKLKEAHPDLFAGYDAVVQRADLGSEKGIVYRLRIKVSGQSEGVTLCSRMRGAEIDCVVVPAS